MPYYILYFFGIGILCYYVINHMTENDIPYLQCVYLYSISWIAGFVIPGAPGGIGVRESVFVYISDNVISQPEAIFVILILRLSTTIGEVFSFIIAKLNKRHHIPEIPN